MHVGVVERRASDFNLCPQIKKNRVTSINLILFDIGNQYLVCGRILRSRSVVNSLGDNVTLIFDLSYMVYVA